MNPNLILFSLGSLGIALLLQKFHFFSYFNIAGLISKVKMEEAHHDKGPSLSDLNYKFNDQGHLVTLTDEPFRFIDQRHYEKLGDVIGLEIYDMLEKEFDAKKLYLPLKSESTFNESSFSEIPVKPSCPIFLSQDFLKNEESLIVFIQGSGVVRPGQWARSVIINHSLDMGSMFPYLRKAKGSSWIILNPNENFGKDENGSRVSIESNSSPEDHCLYVWENIISRSPAKNINIVAHSYGGICTISLLNSLDPNELSRIKRIAFTDSVHFVSHLKKEHIKRFKEIAINWIQSDLPLDSQERSGNKNDCPRFSSGHRKHEYTSGCAIESVFNWFEGISPLDKHKRNLVHKDTEEEEEEKEVKKIKENQSNTQEMIEVQESQSSTQEGQDFVSDLNTQEMTEIQESQESQETKENQETTDSKIQES